MIAYTTLGSNDLEKATAFYDAVLGEMGIGQLWASDTFIGYGTSMAQPMLGICKPNDEGVATSGNGTMIAIACPDKASVHAVYDKALALGGADEGAAGPRGESGFYIGYFRDLDGNKLAAFTQIQPEK